MFQEIAIGIVLLAALGFLVRKFFSNQSQMQDVINVLNLKKR